MKRLSAPSAGGCSAPCCGSGRPLAQAEDVAARTLVAIDNARPATHEPLGTYLADRERVVSDLAGVRRHDVNAPMCSWTTDQGIHAELWPCEDARRYSDGLLRTARLYGVEL